MDYTGYYEFPFPSVLTEEDAKAKDFFLSLPDDEQLQLLDGSQSYTEFHDRVLQRIQSN